jgi:predicted lipoprotein
MKNIKVRKKLFLIPFALVAIAFSSCKKNDTIPPVNTPVTELDVLTDFANVVVNPNYQELQSKAEALNLAAQTLSTSTTDVNLMAAQDAWRAVRVPWELSEGFLFGPVEDFNYDPATDTWPVNTVELDSLLASSDPLTLADIDSLPYSLKGYHPAEYLLFGVGGSKTASQFTTREFQYLISLTQNLYNSVSGLRNDWDVNQPGNFSEQLITAGTGSTRYATRKDAFVAIVAAMIKICNEVANSKMQIPLASHDSTLVESQYAHNATVDFKNNITGIQNVYMCKYFSTGKSLHDIVSASDISLDNNIQSQINTAIGSFDNIDPDYGKAIFTQVGQIQTTQDAINSLQSTLNLLNNFVQTNIKD